MKVHDFCSRTVAVIEPGASLREAARRRLEVA
jgi:hypothetical protein